MNFRLKHLMSVIFAISAIQIAGCERDCSKILIQEEESKYLANMYVKKLGLNWGNAERAFLYGNHSHMVMHENKERFDIIYGEYEYISIVDRISGDVTEPPKINHIELVEMASRHIVENRLNMGELDKIFEIGNTAYCLYYLKPKIFRYNLDTQVIIVSRINRVVIDGRPMR